MAERQLAEVEFQYSEGQIKHRSLLLKPTSTTGEDGGIEALQPCFLYQNFTRFISSLFFFSKPLEFCFSYSVSLYADVNCPVKTHHSYSYSIHVFDPASD